MKTTRELAELFGLQLVGSESVEIQSIAISTKDLEPNSIFVAVQGASNHGLDFLEQAIEKGAVAVLSDRSVQSELPVLIHPNPRAVAGAIAAEIFQTSSRGVRFFGVTGTNGKTSTAYYLQQLLSLSGVRAGLSSSALNEFEGHHFDSNLTTPEAPRLHWLIHQMANVGAAAIVIEVSAQALIRNRVDGIEFEIAGFTNLSRDHLDDFDSMDQYLEAKSKLFTSEICNRAVINVEDQYGLKLLNQSTIPVASIGPGLDYQLSYSAGSLQISGKHTLTATLEISSLMAKNLGLALVMMLESGFSVDTLAKALAKLNPNVPGRLQLVSDHKPHLFVDYAHTPAAVAAAAAELSGRYPELTIVLAASGDRDTGKRADMAQAAAQYANTLIITDQHPRSESPEAIRKVLFDAASKLIDPQQLQEIADPEQGITRAIEITGAGGAILWCGPGHLTYREVKGEKVPFNAIEIARRAQKK